MSDLLRNAVILDTECVAADTLVQLATGEIIEIQDYISGEISGSGLQAGSRTARNVSAFDLVEKGEKEVFLVRPKWGLPIRASAKHYFLTQDGWKATEALSTSDYVLVSQHDPKLPELADVSDDKMKFLGWWIAEGCRSDDNTVTISVVEREYIDLLPNPWPDLLEWRERQNNSVSLCMLATGRNSDGTYRRHPAPEFLGGLLHQYSYEKTLPSWVLSASNRQIALVIAAMFAGDGTVFKDRLGLSYCTTSKRLAEQLVLLLSRFGILSSFSEYVDNRKESYKNVYSIQISGESARLFYSQIPLEGRKSRELADMINLHKQVIPQQRLPKQFTKQINDTLSRDSFPTKKLIGSARVSYYKSSAWCIADIKQFDIHCMKDYQALCFDSLVWVPISSITPAGVCDVYDITTETSEFAANGIIVHNTLGLKRGAGIYELAIYDVELRRLEEHFFSASRVVIENSIQQDVARLATSANDKAIIEHGSFWANIINANLGLKTNDNDIKKQVLKERAPFLYSQIFDAQGAIRADAPMHLLGGKSSATQKPASMPTGMWKVASQVAHDSNIEDVLRPGGALENAIRGKTVWIANAAFESKQLGSYVQAMQQAGEQVTLQQKMQTWNPASPDAFYVTGVDVNEARLQAMATGDWTQVWQAYKKGVPKAGETAVRDILDVTRAYYSYAERLGLASNNGSAYSGVGIDLTHRLFGSLEDDQSLARNLFLGAESHRAGLDTLSESYVLHNVAQHTQALQDVYEGTARGKQLEAEAAQGKGLLHKARLFFDRASHFQEANNRAALLKRLQRAETDFAIDGTSTQEVGFRARELNVLDSDGNNATMRIASYQRNPHDSMEEILAHLESEGNYGNVRGEHAAMSSAMGNLQGEERAYALERYVMQQTSENNANIAKQLVGEGILGAAPKSRVLHTASTGAWMDDAARAVKGGGFGALIAGAGLLAGAGMLFGRSGKDYKEDRNITTFDYNDFLEASTFEGMSEVGMAKAGRHVNTDFGSPYRGPIISSGILQDQEILRERENYLRGQYHVKHFDPERGLFGINSPFERVSGFIPTSRSYNTSGERFSGSGLTGDNLRKINLSDGWDVAVEDADTVKIKRNGFLGAVSSFFGMNPEYSYRLEGIDAPEIQHAGESGSSFGREQPGGSASAVALRKMLEGRDVSLVVNPTDITYGRAVGVLFADGQNVNKQLVTSGRAASLSFYSKTNQAMQNFGAIEYQEELAAKSNRGIWSEPWMQAYRDFRETSGQSITFSTLAKVQKLGSNAALSGGLSLMQQAQASGMYNTAQAQGIAAQAKYYHGGTDDYSPIVMGAVNAHYDGYMTQLQTELNGYLTNKGRKQQHSLSSRDGYAQLDSHLAQQGIAGKRPPELRMAEIYDKQRTTKAVKRAQMQRAQQDLNHRIFTSPIGHHVM